jgi:hypothetical protein
MEIARQSLLGLLVSLLLALRRKLITSHNCSSLFGRWPYGRRRPASRATAGRAVEDDIPRSNRKGGGGNIGNASVARAEY